MLSGKFRLNDEIYVEGEKCSRYKKNRLDYGRIHRDEHTGSALRRGVASMLRL